jgi:hypothetical protein
MNLTTAPVVRTLALRPLPPVPAPAVQERLGEALAEPGTILVMVFGRGRESDQAEARCRALADDPCFEGVRVVRIPDLRALTPEQRRRWLAGGGRLAVLGTDRAQAVRLARPDAVELFVAMSMVAAA